MDEDDLKQWENTGDPLPFTLGEFASFVGTKRAHVDQLISTGQIETVTINGSVRIPFSTCEKFVRNQVDEGLQMQRGLRVGLAYALAKGIIAECGLDKNGHGVFKSPEDLDQDRPGISEKRDRS